MMTTLRYRALPALFTVCVALTALAGGTALEPQAAALIADYEELVDRFDACPGGDCAEATAILDDFADLELDLADLEIDREELEPCHDCATLDALLDEARALSATAEEEAGGWKQDR